MAVSVDVHRGMEVAESLHPAFFTVGIHGHNDMPEDLLPAGVDRGSPDHIAFVTLTVSIDYQRNASALWESARRTFEDSYTRYLFDFRALHETPLSKVVADVQRHQLSRKPQKDALIWRAIGVTFFEKWQGDPVAFLQDCGWEAPCVLERLGSDRHLEAGRLASDFPYLRGPKIGPLWLRMLRDNVSIDRLRHLERVPIPVDVHIARATLAVGVVRGSYSGSLGELFRIIRKAWFESVRGLRVGQREMIALDVDEPLWHLSRYGCTNRHKQTGQCPLLPTCEAREFCVQGRIRVESTHAELDT